MKNRFTTRNSNIELLRIITMIMIIVLHYFNNGGVLDAIRQTSVNYHITWILESVCYCSVNCYILISGYFLADKEDYNYKKIIDIVLQVLFYSLGLYLLFCCVGLVDFNIKTMITGFMFPIIHGEYWYATVFIVSVFAVPYIGKLTNQLDKNEFKKLLIVFGIIFSVIPTVVFFAGNTIGLKDGYSLIWFVYLYFVAGYIKKFQIQCPKRILVIGIIIFSLIPFFVKLFQQTVLGTEYWNFYKYNSLPVLGSSLCWFLLFISFKKRKNLLINVVASTTFGIFLFHTQYIMRDYLLWGKIIKPTFYMKESTGKYVIHIICSVLLIFIVGVVVDLIRSFIFTSIKGIYRHFSKD